MSVDGGYTSRGEAAGSTGESDPLHEFELRHNRLLIAVADHVAGCNAGWSAAMMLSRGVPGVVFREANP